MKKPRLVPYWRKAYRMLSVQAQALAISLIGFWQIMPEDLKKPLPPSLIYWVAMGILVLGIFGSLVKQNKVSGE